MKKFVGVSDNAVVLIYVKTGSSTYKGSRKENDSQVFMFNSMHVIIVRYRQLPQFINMYQYICIVERGS